MGVGPGEEGRCSGGVMGRREGEGRGRGIEEGCFGDNEKSAQG